MYFQPIDRRVATNLRRGVVQPILWVTGQNGSGQNGMDKIVYGQNVIGQNGIDKMVRTNGTDKMVASFGIDYN